MSYILFQMYGCLRKRDYVIEFIYFVYSFVLILGKLLFVCLYASKIHDESIEALGYMYPVQYKMDNEDVRYGYFARDFVFDFSFFSWIYW